MRIVALNSGSSSLKAELYEVTAELLDPLPAPAPLLKLDPQASLEGFLEQCGPVDAVGHRFVHGGEHFHQPVVITREVRRGIAESASMAPVHVSRALDLVSRAACIVRVPQVAVFDTAFHRTLEPAAFTYAVPPAWKVRRYGFHGLSYQYAARRALGLLPGASRLLACHLGSGASLCAIRDGKSVDTTMGFTPLEGLVMSTRSGTVDPGLVLWLEQNGHTSQDLDRILNHESGLAGLSNISDGDMRKVLAARDAGDPAAVLAYDVYLHRLTREAGAMVASLGGLDSLVFTGGVGENSTVIRRSLCERLAWLGVGIAPALLTPTDTVIHTRESRVHVAVIHAREEWEIARECFRLLR